jgi:hypothetical protein
MTKSVIKIIEDSLVAWPESVDSQLWNDRIQDLIRRVNEFEAKKIEEAKKQDD